MSDKPARPPSRRPSYLTGPGSPARPGQGQAQPEAATEKKGEAPRRQEQALEDKQLCEWRVWLLPRRPVVSTGVVAALLLCVGLAYWALPNALFVGIITIILFNRLAPYLFPMKYVLTEQTAGYRAFLARDTREWGRIFTYYQYPDGVLLANDVRTVRGRLREGLFLYYETGGANRDEVLKIVQSKLKPPQEALAPKTGKEPYKGGVGSALRRIRRLRDKE